MASYKGIDVDESLIDLIGYMGKAEEYREHLQNLQTVWDNLTLLGYLSGTATDMSETRNAFQHLSSDLLNQLGCETLKKTTLAIKSKAQVAVDIMIRNLFERTADIGFLAMDNDIREYLEKFAPLNSRSTDEQAQQELERDDASLLARFKEYVQKYSVYDNIILLDIEGNVLLQLDENNPVKQSHDPLIEASLTTSDSYVETFRHSDLLPNQSQSLIYSYRVTSADGKNNLGVLCLSFRFTNETESIFANLSRASDWSVVTLLDQNGTVIASSDNYHIPTGAQLDHGLDQDWKVMRFSGREYISATHATQGYQGYMGPGWYGHVMLPLEHAFDQDSDREFGNIPDNALEAVMENPQLFSEELRGIPRQAARIQRALNRSVWNGNVSQHGDQKALNPAFSKVLLWEISNTGMRTQHVFEQSIHNLHQTVVSSILQDSQFQAALAIDIMDRNLYERANDCRWWALASIFRTALSAAEIDESTLAEMTQTLKNINALYTVYDNLLVFNKAGQVLTVSNPAYQEFCGRTLNDAWVRQALSLDNSQNYAVSDFEATALYQNKHSYIYSAAIRAPSSSQIVGGIGIVFDSAPQFSAMLVDALPRDESGKVPEGCFGVFANRNRQIITSTLPELTPGMKLELDDTFFDIDNGERKSGIVTFNGHYHAVGACMSKSYREYKSTSDTYRNDVIALIFSPLGECIQDNRRSPSTIDKQMQNREVNTSGGECIDIATFFVDSHCLGISTEHVVEAIDTKGLTTAPGADGNLLGYIMFRDKPISVVGLWGLLGKNDKRHLSQEPQIIVIRHSENKDELLGIMVDELGEIPEIPIERIEKVPHNTGGYSGLTESLIKPANGKNVNEMIVLLSVTRLWNKFMQEHDVPLLMDE